MNDDKELRYISYEELEAQKKKDKAKKGAILTVVILFLIIGVLLAAGIIMSGNGLLFSGRDEEKSVANLSQEQEDGRETPYSLEIKKEPPEEKRMVVATDVSRIVDKCLDGVVGISTEIYSSFTAISSGSGIILDKDGYIVTNDHVISGGESITVTLNDGRTFPATIVGKDENTDIAVIKITADDLHPAEFGDSDTIRVGETAVAIGNPTGQLMGTVTAGIISALSRNIMINNNIMTLIQTDASINTGNSGGPLINQYGRVIGMNSAKISSSNYEGLGFAIPINTVKPIVDELISQGYVSGRPLAGISVGEISFMASAFYGIPQGLYVNGSERNGNASSAGISEGDVITAVNGERVTDLSSAVRIRNTLKPEDQITLSVYRNGQVFDLSFKLSEQNKENAKYNF